ncbi:MAG: secretin and TonB N-terminal domain-containing protein [Isosphaeraceae bacterium]
MPKSGLTQGAIGFALGLVLAYQCWFGPARQATTDPPKTAAWDERSSPSPAAELEPPRPWPLATAPTGREPGDWSDSEGTPAPKPKDPAPRSEPLILAVLEVPQDAPSNPSSSPAPEAEPEPVAPSGAMPLELAQEVVPAPPRPQPPGDGPIRRRPVPPDPLPTIEDDLPPALPGQPGKIKLKVQDEDVRQAFDILAAQGDVNILVNPGVSGKITIDIKDVTFEQALDVVLKMANLGMRREKNIIYIYTAADAELLELKSKKLESRVYRLNYIRAADLAPFLRPLLSPRVGVLTLTMSSGGASNVGGGPGGGGVAGLGAGMGAPGGGGIGGGGAGMGGGTPVGGNAAMTSGSSFSAGSAVSSGADVGGNSLASQDTIVIRDYPEAFPDIESVIRQLDVQPDQVLIEAVILSVDVSNNQSLGVNFSVVDDLSRLAFVSGNESIASLAVGFTPAVVTGIASAVAPIQGNRPGQFQAGYLDNDQGMKFGFISSNIKGFIKNLETMTKVNVLASPRILVVNKQRAEIQLGQRLGFKNTVTNLTSSLQTVQFLSVGTLLTLRPFVSSDGMIRMEIHPEKSSGSIDGAGVPQATTSELTSNILIPDGVTLVIGGLMDSTDTGFTQGLIGLNRLPLLGPLFRQQTTDVKKTELIVLLTPRIITRCGLPAPMPGLPPMGPSGVPNSGNMPGPSVGPLISPPPSVGVGIEGGENWIPPLPEGPSNTPIWGNRLRLTPSDAPIRPARLSDNDDPATAFRKPEGSRKPVVLRPERATTSAPVAAASPSDPEVRRASAESSKAEAPARPRLSWPFRSQPQAPAPPTGPSTAPKAGYRPGDLTRALVGNVKKTFQPEKTQTAAEVSGLVPTSYTAPRQETGRRPVKAAGGFHTVQAGEDFASIAAAHYGTSRLGPALWMFNRPSVPTLGDLRPGLSIAIPPREELPDRADLLRAPR